ncbi:hypothetical protein ABQE69_05235 [Mycolicibacillus trivialis]|uniref:Low molecular weight antigen MTB12-like C-terminal domain-containing protein n=1 Tax=Mycolicibacillus trivialis TaxID=1798 RepID=A0A1X2ENQ9_9MYCO|nr:hypothetical protein [Mycolicibacillus trivialis]ORX07301.1 hypothetical protein AWC30_00705 [Mycolicibacillus trivialis]
MTVKSLATGAAAVAALGAAALGVTGVIGTAPAPQVQLTTLGAPLPLEPAEALPTADQLTGVLTSLADPAVPFASKGNLIEGGIGGVEGTVADRKLQKAARKGQLPLSFSVDNIAPAGPGTAAADVTVSGPKMAARTMNLTFVNQGGWELSRSSATQLIQAASAL